MINATDQQHAEGEQYCSDEGVYLNSKGEVVYGKDPDRKVQIVAPGSCVPMAVANRYNLQAQAPVEADEPDEKKAVSAAPANKAVAATPQNKGNAGKK